MRHVAMIAILAVAPALLASSWPSVTCAAPPPPTARYTVKNSATTPGRTAQRPTAAGETTKRAAEKPQVTTMINVQLLTGAEGNGVTAFRWQQVFQKLDVMLTIRQARSDDKPSVTERKSGGVRQIDVIGRLDRKGQVVFPDRTFTSSDTTKLSEWLDELKAYGAQGSPASQPAWGLSKQQFGTIHAALSKPLARDPKDEGVLQALSFFELPKEHPIRMSNAAERLLKDKSTNVTQSLAGISQGTALAALLGEQGLGFYPRRQSDGGIDLVVVPRNSSDECWPIGWPLEKSGPQTAPKLFAFEKVPTLSEADLDSVLIGAAELTGIPVLIDRPGLEAKGIELSQTKVSFLQKRTTWSLVLSELLFKAKAKHELLIDEAGHPFLWITHVGVPRRAQKDQ